MSGRLIFENDIHGSGDFECIIWADKPPKDRLRFTIDRTILEFLGGTPSIVLKNNVAICNTNRDRILAACEVAHNAQLDELYVVLQQWHFPRSY
jgi:hypothetical protein